MKKLIGFSFLVAIGFSGCAQNGFKQFYTPYSNIEKRVITEEKEAEVNGFYSFDNIEKDRQIMYENGWVPIGISHFNGGDTLGKIEDIAEVAKENKSVKVLAYSKNLGQQNYGSLSTNLGYGMTYSAPIVVNRMEYLADYYKKAKQYRCGCRDIPLTIEQKQLLGTNKGVAIKSLVKNQPGFNADILVGDIVLKINDIGILDSEHFGKTIEQLDGQEVVFTINRNGQIITKNVKLNSIKD